ncbi:hypothetical protein [Nocardia puris]|nr:hypothetical protein [Nocardia puris]
MTAPRRPLSPTTAHLIAVALGTFVTVLILGVIYAVRVGAIG